MQFSTLLQPRRVIRAIRRRTDSLSTQSLSGADELSPVAILSKTPEQLENLVKPLSRDHIDLRYGSDRWLHNYMLSIWENVNGCTHLSAYPWNLTLGITSTCNAKCTFCSVPMRRSRHPALENDLDNIPHLEKILSYTRLLLLTGGEPTIHPRFGQMLRRLKEIMDPRAYITMITHGDRIHRFKAELAEANVNLVVSLNAATAAKHHSLMRLGEDSFPRILESISWARSIGKIVDLSIVVVRENLEEIPVFLRMAEDMGAHGVYLRTLIPGDYYSAMFPNPQDFHSLPAWSHPEIELWQERARETIRDLKIEVYGDPDQWHLPMQSAEMPANTDRETLVASVRNDPPIILTKGDILPEGSAHDAWRRPVANPYGRMAPFACSYPWYAIKILDPSQRLYPCSFMHQIMGYDDVGLHGSKEFFELWNSPALVHLRKTLMHGPLLPECITCPYQMGGSGQCQSDHAKQH